MHGQKIAYKVCVYPDDTSPYADVLKTFNSYDKAKKFLSEYLKKNDYVSRAYIEKIQMFKNDKRNQWN